MGHVELLELFLISTSVGMVGHSELPISFLDLISGCLLINAEQIIELLSIRCLFLLATSSTTHIFEATSTEGESATTEKHILYLKLYCIILYYKYLSQRISSSANILD